jgi:uncharacterized protein YqcC (DUF446 family)
MIDPTRVRARLDAVIAAMQAHGAWDVARPDPAAFADMGAFGGNTMAFAQWLRFVFVPNVEALITAGGPWPESSSVAVRAVREGDTDPVIAALVDSLAAFDALFEPPEPLDPAEENDAGWALVHTPGHTPADLETAVEHFRRAIAAEQPMPQAVGNLGNALVELGRDADAIAELERIAAGDDMVGATAHNWLGWRLTATEPARALEHLRAATRIRPTWGVAWQNLARVLDATGDVAGACRAYGEAITCGDAHDDAYARDRRLQLEMMLLAANEPVPPVPAQVLADSIAFGIVRATAARLAAPRAFAIRPTTIETPWAMIGVVDGGRALGLGIVGAASDTATLTTNDAGELVQRVLDPARAGDDGATELLKQLAAADPAGLTPFDAAMWIRDVALAPLGAAWRWELARYRPPALAVCEVGGEVSITVTARGSGVEIALFAEAPGGARTQLVAATPAELLGLATQIADATVRARAARDAFAARAFGIERVTELFAPELRGVREPSLDVRYPAWPRAWFVDARDGVTIVWLEESADGCTITIGREHWTVRSEAELRALSPVLADAVRVDRKRLRPERMAVRDRFRVREAFGVFAAGTIVELVNDLYDPRESYHRYEFVGPGPVRAMLDEMDDADVKILAAIDRYLEPIAR